MAVALLLPRHVFGLKGDVTDNFAYYDEQTVVYPAGHNMIIHNLEQRTQKFLTGTEKTDEITAMCVSPNKKFVAVAEKAEKGMITIWDLTSLKKKRPLTCAESVSREFVCLAFSPDSKYLMAQGGGPDWLLCLWTWEKNPPKLIATLKTTNATHAPLYTCSFSANDNNNIAVTGNGILKQLRLTESAMKLLQNPLGMREPENYISHAWVGDERLIVGTDTGVILVVDGSELKAVIEPSGESPSVVSCIAVYSKGFVTGGDDGVLTIFERVDDKQLYKLSKSFHINESNAARIQHMSISPTEESLVCCLENIQVMVFPLLNAEIIKTEDNNFDFLTQSFHTGAVTGIDICIRKPLVATCGMDKSVRIWNYLDKTLELVKAFSDEAHSIAFHPSGLHLLVGFSDKLRLMNVLMDDIRWFKEFPVKACRECRFSDGGQYFAAVNGNIIQVYQTYTCELFAALKGHNGKVRSVSWVADDTKIVSCGMDGAVYQWVIKDPTGNNREVENVIKACNYTCAVSDGKDGKTIYAVGSDRKLKMITAESNAMTEFDSPVVLTQAVLSHSGRMLFCGSESGTIFSYKFPLQSPGEYQEYMCHHKSVTRLRMSYDDGYLFAVGEDGCLFILDVRDKDVHVSKKDKEMLPFAEEILVTKSDLEERSATVAELRSKVEELTHQMEYQTRLKEMNHNDKIKELTEKHAIDAEAEKSKYDLLLQDKNDMEMEFEEKIKQMEEKHAATIESLDQQYQVKIMTEVDRHQQLEHEKELLNEKWDEQNAQLVDGHERLVQELTDDYEYKLQEERMHVEHLKEEKEELIRQIEETRRQVEEDADREIEELKEKYEARLNAEKEANLGLKGQNGIMKKKFMALQKEITERSEDIKAMDKKQKELYHEIYLLKKEIALKKKEVTERDQTIAEKEKRIYDLKKKNQELEKFKFVLDYKIKELKKQLEPRDAEIQAKKEQIKEMDAELERYHKNNSDLERRISEMKSKLLALKKELQLQRRNNTDAQVLLKRYRTHLHETIQHIQDPKALKESIKKLYQSHVTEEIRATQLDADIAKEYNRQREYLEKSVDSLKKKLTKDMELHRSDNMRIMQENVALIKEINELRKEIKAMKQAQRAKEMAGSRKRQEMDPAYELEVNREEIRRLREQLHELEGSYRPSSRDRLPPMDGFTDVPPTETPTAP